jgi:hypothetical protein
MGAAAYACVLCCHFPGGAFVHAPAAGVSFGYGMDGEIVERAVEAGLRFLLGLGLSAFIWAPALAARQYAAINRAVEGYGRYSNHFVYLHQLFYSPWGYGLSVPGPEDGMSFALGWSHLLLWRWCGSGSRGIPSRSTAVCCGSLAPRPWCCRF